MTQEVNVVRRGIYNVEYFSGAQVSLYIGDVWVDEITTLSYGYQQDRRPIYGYASTLYDDLSEGQILVQGQFTINFKEAGYLWLILNRYRTQSLGGSDLTEVGGDPFINSSSTTKNTVERLVNNEVSVFERNRLLQELTEESARTYRDVGDPGAARYRQELAGEARRVRRASAGEISASLGGFASNIRARGGVGRAENVYESFEDAVWGRSGTEEFLETRRTDDPRLNPFDIYVTFGDFAGDGHANHTIEKIRTVNILGKSKQIVIDGMPIQEQYSFVARELI